MELLSHYHDAFVLKMMIVMLLRVQIIKNSSYKTMQKHDMQLHYATTKHTDFTHG